MPVFEYESENLSLVHYNSAVSQGVRSDFTKKVSAELNTLVQSADHTSAIMNLVRHYVPLMAEMSELDTRYLPAKTFLRHIDDGDDKYVVTDANTKVALCFPPDNSAAPEVSGDPISPESAMNLTDDEEVYRQVARGGFNYQAYAIEPGRADERTGVDYLEHYSLGFMSDEGKYEPRVTVLDAQHPARQRVVELAIASV